jgi:hypothetical protein
MLRCSHYIVAAYRPCSHMADEKHNDNHSLFDKLVAVLLRQSWLDVLGDAGVTSRAR